MLDEAEAAGRLGPGAVIIEPTSGNTGIGLASVAAARGYRVIIVMPDTMSAERRALMKAYGAELVLTPGAGGMAEAIAKADELAAGIPGAMVAGQFVNPANPAAHEATTGPELWQDTDGQLDVFVAGVGTGGTITGVGRLPQAAEPRRAHRGRGTGAQSAVLSGSPAGAHGLQGIGAGFVPEVLDTGVYDEVLTATEQDAYAAARPAGPPRGRAGRASRPARRCGRPSRSAAVRTAPGRPSSPCCRTPATVTSPPICSRKTRKAAEKFSCKKSAAQGLTTADIFRIMF